MSPNLKLTLLATLLAVVMAAFFSLAPDPPIPGGVGQALASTKLSQIVNGNLVSATTDQVVTVRSGTTDVLASVGSLAGENLTGVVVDNGSGGATIGAGQVTNAMTAQAGANTMKGNWTGSSASESDNAMPSCSDSGGNHLNYVSGTGVTCGTSDSHVGTVTSVATTAPIAGGTITSTGTLSITGAAGQVLAGSSPAFTATPTLGVNGTTAGTLALASSGASGASITIQNLGAMSGYNFNLPATAGGAGQILTTQGGGSNSMTWASDNVGGGMFNYSDNGVTLTANTYFTPIGGGGIPQTTEAAVDVPSPSATTVTNLQVGVSAAPGVGNSYTITLRDAASDTALTCQISGGSATSCSDLTHSVNVAQNDLIDWKVVSAGTIVTTPTLTISANNGTSNVGVTSIATTTPITGGTITATGAIACATCVTSAASLTSTDLVIGSGTQGIQTDSNWTDTSGAIVAALASASLDLTSASPFKIPNSAGAAPTAEASEAYDTTQHKYVAGANGNTTASFCTVICPPDNATNTAGNNLVASTINTTETVFASSCTIKANTFIQNKMLRVTAVFDVVSSSTAVSFRTRLRWGGLTGTILSDSGAVTVNNSAIKGAMLQFAIQGTAAASASANVEVGKNWQVSGGGGTQVFGFETIQSPVAVATNADKVLQFTELFGGNTAGNSVTLRQWMVEECN